MATDAHRVPGAMHSKLTRLLLVAISFCAFHCAAFARVVTTSAKADPDAGVLVNSTSSDNDVVLEGGSLSTISINKRDLSSLSIERRQASVSPEKALARGQMLLDTYQQSRSSNTQYPPGLSQRHQREIKKYIHSVSDPHSTPPAELHPSLIEDGITVGPNWYHSLIRNNDVNSPMDPSYENSYFYDQQSQTGIIVAQNNYRHNKNAVHWSEAVYAEYIDEHKGERGIPQHLKYIYRATITNTDTQKFIREGIARTDYVERRVVGGCQRYWYVFEPASQTFKVLLGSNNGQGVGYLVVDHNIDTGGKQISRIHAYKHESLESYALKFDLE